MNNYKWSEKNLAFFPVSMIDEYKNAGWDLGDAIDVSDSVYSEFSAQPPIGKVRGSKNKKPIWIDASPASDDDKKSNNNDIRQGLVTKAYEEIKWRQYALDKGIATEKEISDLDSWNMYLVAINRIDLLNPEWPEIPS